MSARDAALGGTLRNRSRRAAFFCYHSVSRDGPRWLALDPDAFAGHLRLLRRLGFAAGDHAALEGLASGQAPPRPLAFLTFDDGFRDNYTTVLPLLREHGFKAIVFLLPPYVDAGAPLAWPEVEERRAEHPEVMRSLTWEMVEEMAAAGVEFGSHGLEHRRLPQLGDDELDRELRESRARIADRLGRCDSIAYPFGDWDERVAAAAQAAGYRFGFTSPTGDQRSATALSIPRLPVDQRDRPARFALKLAPAGRRVMLSPAKSVLRRLRA